MTRVALGDSRLAFVAELDAWLVKRQADAQEVLRRPDNVTSENTMILDIPPSPAVLASCPKGGRALPDRYFIRDRRSKRNRITMRSPAGNSGSVVRASQVMIPARAGDEERCVAARGSHRHRADPADSPGLRAGNRTRRARLGTASGRRPTKTSASDASTVERWYESLLRPGHRGAH